MWYVPPNVFNELMNDIMLAITRWRRTDKLLFFWINETGNLQRHFFSFDVYILFQWYFVDVNIFKREERVKQWRSEQT